MLLKQFNKNCLTGYQIFDCCAFVSFHMFAIANKVGSKNNCNLTINLFISPVRILKTHQDDCMMSKVSPIEDIITIISPVRIAVMG